MEPTSRESELRAELAQLMARSDELLLELQSGRERMEAIMAELEAMPRQHRLPGQN